MNDTPLHVAQKQYEIHISKPLQERFKMAFSLTELSRKIILNQLKQQNPSLTESELCIELFKICYKDSFDEEKMQNIISDMYFSLQKNKKTT